MSVLHTINRDELIPAFQENLNAAVLSLQSPQINTHALATVIQSWSAAAFPLFNAVAYANITGETAITTILQPYRRHQTTAIWIRLPTSQPESLDEQLLAHGLRLADVQPCMAIKLDTMPQQTFNAHIVQVQNEAQCRDWVQVQSLSNGGLPQAIDDIYMRLMLPAIEADSPRKIFVAYENGRPVACSLFHLAGGVAGIWQVATIPEARRKGYGTAITFAALAAAAKQGYKIGVLFASQMGAPVYRKMGFQEILQAKLYLFDGLHAA